MATGDLYRVAFNYNVHGQSCVNVMYMKQTVVGAGTAQTAATALAPLLKDVFKIVLTRGSTSNTCNVSTQLVARLLTDQGQASANFADEGPLDAALPALNAMVVRIRTGFSGRSHRGRIFVGAVPASWVSGSVMNATGITKYGLFATALIQGFMGNAPQSGYQLGVFSREKYRILSNPFDDYWKPATQLTVPSEVASMRSRKVGVGA